MFHRRLFIAAALSIMASAHGDPMPRTPIRHLVVVIGENVSFDALYGTYVPTTGQRIDNLRSRGIVGEDGLPGPRYADAAQHRYHNVGGRYSIDLEREKAYEKLPAPSLVGTYDANTLVWHGDVPDPRFVSLTSNGPYSLTRFAPFGLEAGVETGDPVHRFFQMWQQTAGSNDDLRRYVWVATTAGRGADTPEVTAQHPGQGGEVMGFLNMAAGDAPYFRQLADQYALSDNYHQSLMGGTTANFIALATGDLARYELDGKVTSPPAQQIENPNPQPGSDNFYRQDGTDGGSYVRCDRDDPGADAIRAVLKRRDIHPNCAENTWYLVNNYDPPFLSDGTTVPLGPDVHVYPPQTAPEIGSALTAGHVDWAWFTGGRDREDLEDDRFYEKAAELAKERDPTATEEQLRAETLEIAMSLVYNNSGDPLVSFPRVIHGPDRARLKNLKSFYATLDRGDLPAVSFVVPKNVDSGHPGYSATSRYEAFIRDLLTRFEKNPALWADTAILITTDEGGGSFDSGYIQTLDFFGDGTRIPFLVISPYARKGYVDHVYQDHASILKFIEYNWNLPPLSSRSRDRLPNPVTHADDPYRPINSPAIGDLTSLFDFRRRN